MAARKRTTYKWVPIKPKQPSESAGKKAWDSYEKKMRDHKKTRAQIKRAKASGSSTAAPVRRSRTKKKARRR